MMSELLYCTEATSSSSRRETSSRTSDANETSSRTSDANETSSRTSDANELPRSNNIGNLITTTIVLGIR